MPMKLWDYVFDDFGEMQVLFWVTAGHCFFGVGEGGKFSLWFSWWAKSWMFRKKKHMVFLYQFTLVGLFWEMVLFFSTLWTCASSVHALWGFFNPSYLMYLFFFMKIPWVNWAFSFCICESLDFFSFLISPIMASLNFCPFQFSPIMARGRFKML